MNAGVDYQVKPPEHRAAAIALVPSIIGIFFIATWSLGIGDAYDWGGYRTIAQGVAAAAALGLSYLLAFHIRSRIVILRAVGGAIFTGAATWSTWAISGGLLLPILTFIFVGGDQLSQKSRGA